MFRVWDHSPDVKEVRDDRCLSTCVVSTTCSSQTAPLNIQLDMSLLRKACVISRMQTIRHKLSKISIKFTI